MMLTYAERFLAPEDTAPLRPMLAHFAAWMAGCGLAEAAVGRPDLDQYLYALAVEGANSAALDRAVQALKGYFAYRAEQEGAPDPAAGLTFFGESEGERERYIKAEWGLSDAFYGIVPDRRRSGNA